FTAVSNTIRTFSCKALKASSLARSSPSCIGDSARTGSDCVPTSTHDRGCCYPQPLTMHYTIFRNITTDVVHSIASTPVQATLPATPSSKQLCVPQTVCHL